MGTIGNNILFYRELRHLKVKELAKLVGCSVGALSHLEKGTRKPSLEMLYNLADALNISIINLVMDDAELQRFYFDEAVKAFYPGSEQLTRVMDILKKNNEAWADAKRIAIVNLDDLKKG